MSFDEHSDPEVREALIRLTDALSQRERNTGVSSVLIFREYGFCFRAVDGKPVDSRFPLDAQLIDINLRGQ